MTEQEFKKNVARCNVKYITKNMKVSKTPSKTLTLFNVSNKEAEKWWKLIEHDSLYTCFNNLKQYWEQANESQNPKFIRGYMLAMCAKFDVDKSVLDRFNSIGVANYNTLFGDYSNNHNKNNLNYLKTTEGSYVYLRNYFEGLLIRG